MSKVVVSASELTIEFPVYNSSHRSLKRVIASAAGGVITGSKSGHVLVTAVKNANFEFYEGDRIGLIGHNGAGKSTLLRTLAGVYHPSSGKLTVNGSVLSLLDLAMGLDSEATGCENIYIRGILFGLTPKEIDLKFNEIAEFSELGDYLNVPVRTYSSGMLLRLAFSIFSVITPEIILMDEWLSVGDEGFNAKASLKLKSMVGSSALLVIASHDKGLIKSLCNRVFKIEHGIIFELKEGEF